MSEDTLKIEFIPMNDDKEFVQWLEWCQKKVDEAMAALALKEEDLICRNVSGIEARMRGAR